MLAVTSYPFISQTVTPTTHAHTYRQACKCVHKHKHTHTHKVLMRKIHFMGGGNQEISLFGSTTHPEIGSRSEKLNLGVLFFFYTVNSAVSAHFAFQFILDSIMG